MTFFCNGCNKPQDFDRDYGMLIISAKRELRRFCRFCCNPKVYLPDVFWDGKPEENLADDPRTGKPRVFSGKAEKAAYLKERGLVEAGDRVGGAPFMAHKQPVPKLDSRHEVRMALKKVKEMGRDVRRQEYLRIIKENRAHA